MANAKIDGNYKGTLIGVSSDDLLTPTLVAVDPITNRLLVNSTAQPPVTTSTVYNTTLTNANTEYSQLLPANTREFRFMCRTLFDVRYAFVTGKVATPTTPYLTLPAGMEYSSDNDNFTSTTLYFASGTSGVILELEVWT